jgi:hypothetical protein
MMPKNQISRRTALTLLTAAGAGTLLGCDPDTSATPAGFEATAPDPLLVAVGSGLGLLRGTAVQELGVAVPTADAAAVFATAPAGADSRFWRKDLVSGVESSRITLSGSWIPQAVSADGSRVALTTSAVSPTSGKPAGRAATTVLVASVQGEAQRLELPGNFVPEAFTADRTGLFVLEWLPAQAPEHYRVRLVDLATATVTPLLTRDKSQVPLGAEEEMRGDGRQAVLAPDRTVLYTLYTHQPDHQHTGELTGARPGSDVHAFVHALSLSEHWAYCIDLPHPFGEKPASGHAMAISPDGTRLFVVDAGSGAVALIGTDNLMPLAVVSIPPAEGAAHAAFGRAGLFVGAGRSVRMLSESGLAVTAHWQAAQPISGMAISPDGTRLYLGQPDAVTWHDPVSGAVLGRVAAPGLVELRGGAGWL